MIITFIGNCQTTTLCFYFQKLFELQNYDISWISYGSETYYHLGEWSDKCKNKLLDYDASIEKIKVSDVIIYQEIVLEKSPFSNYATLKQLAKSNCKLLKMTSIYLDYNNYENSIKELENRELTNVVDIKVAYLFKKFNTQQLMLPSSFNHPNTFLFMEVMKKICELINVHFFTEEQYNEIMQNNNYAGLP
jgi:hypothetical protein